ncbi:uncharacterized protein METZ01_LOCUS290478 [marine metagenome]|uniref:Uncharacterized protein n=1 Tax=marine metagenome TaxID=408172 RepID=A0A382LLB8_9ZZZZ
MIIENRVDRIAALSPLLAILREESPSTAGQDAS